jgi:hypothetical protein
MGSQLAIEQSKGARRTIDCTNLDQFPERWGALGSWLTKGAEMLGHAPFNAGDGGHVC